MSDERPTSRRTGFEEIETELDHARVGPPSGRSAPKPPSRFFVAFHGSGTTVVREVCEGDELVVGRGAEAAFVVDDTKASRRHARLLGRADGVFVEDLGSRNGTALNDRILEGAGALAVGGDVVRVPGGEIAVAGFDGARGEARGDVEAAGGPRDTLEGVVVADPSMTELFAFAKRVAVSNAAVLLCGETGVGKDVAARQIHAWSPRAEGPFRRVNCAALPEGLLESELFGYEKGAFTGAQRRKTGYFEAAIRGTLFIDEIGEMPLAAQVKLLNVLETKSIVRVGGTEDVPIDVRIIVATHRDLRAMVAAGRFREDLFYRISTFTLVVPPLRARPTEITLLAELFARALAADGTGALPVFAEDARVALVRHAWPGNVRELRNAVEHAVVLAEGGVVRASHLPASVGAPGSPRPVEPFAASVGPSSIAPATPTLPPPADPEAPTPSMRDRVVELERASIEAALAAEGGNQTRAAKRLGMSRRTLVYKLTRLGLRD